MARKSIPEKHAPETVHAHNTSMHRENRNTLIDVPAAEDSAIEDAAFAELQQFFNSDPSMGLSWPVQATTRPGIDNIGLFSMNQEFQTGESQLAQPLNFWMPNSGFVS